MYAETSGLMFPSYLSSSDYQQFDDFCHSHKSITTCLDSLIQSSTISDYDLGGEGDLFKAPQPIIIQDPLFSLDPCPMTCDMSMISCGEDPKVTLQNEDFLNDVFYECKNLLAKQVATGTESSPYSDIINFKTSTAADDDDDDDDDVVKVKEDVLHPSSYQIPKSMSSDSLTSMDWIQGAQVKPSYLNFNEIDFGNAYGMRRAFSEGDIKTLADGNTSLIHHHHHHPLGQPSPLITEDRMQKLSRYRNKKTKRNFGRKIKYACRKALADSQPRIRGRFAKTDESDIILRK